MALGISGSKGGINKSKKTTKENSVTLFKELLKINKSRTKNGYRIVRK